MDYTPQFTLWLVLTLAQDAENKKSGAEAPHFLSLNQDIVARSQEQKCGLKYVMFSLYHKLSKIVCPARLDRFVSLRSSPARYTGRHINCSWEICRRAR